MVERRKSARNRCLLGAHVVFNARSSTMSCQLRNHSEDGALLKFGETPYIPDQLEIVLDNRTTLMSVQVAWRRGDAVGIRFSRSRFLTELKDDSRKNAAASRIHITDQTVH